MTDETREKMKDEILKVLNETLASGALIVAAREYDCDWENNNAERIAQGIFNSALENNNFYEEVRPWDKAMEYLAECDPSLKESLKLASGFNISEDGIDCEFLATLHKSKANLQRAQKELPKLMEIIETVRNYEQNND